VKDPYNQQSCRGELGLSLRRQESLLLEFQKDLNYVHHLHVEKQLVLIKSKSTIEHKIFKLVPFRIKKNLEKIVHGKIIESSLKWFHMIVEFTLKAILLTLFVFFTSRKERSLYMRLGVFLLIIVKISCCVTGCNPSNCNTTTNKCTACITGYYFTVSTNGTCTSCSTPLSNCNSCSNSTICSSCVSQYYLNIPTNSTCSTCSSFIANCLICNNQSSCSSCTNTSYFLSSGNTSCTLCSSAIANCLICNNQTSCSSCSSTSYFLSNGSTSCTLCSSAIANCQSCSNQTYCSLCSTLNYF